MKNKLILRIINNPFEVYRKGKILLRYRRSKMLNKRLLSSSGKVDFHYGVWGIGNAGDIVLFQEVENTIQKHPFYQRDLGTGEICEEEIELLNKKARVLVLGGGGLFLKDSNSNSNSGWQFNIKESRLDKLHVPLVLFAVGYNRFRGQEEFDEVFESHLLKTISKAAFVGLRNTGSINAIKTYLPEELQSKIKFQPCPTTIIKKLHPEVEQSFNFNRKRDKKIAINIAFDREEMRFKGRFKSILASLVSICESYKAEAWKVEFVGHCKVDKKIKPYIKSKFPFKDLTYDSYDQIIDYYKNVPITIGMRGHAQMIPFGIGNGILSLISHDKMKWFLDDIKHPEWGIEILSEQFESDLQEKLEKLISDYDAVQKKINLAQDMLYQLTMDNVKEINSLR
ncbi:polysaccharide pyruvyl transferase family protein [Marinifilum sp.]|uniref:polysaccharide pyruvyl transferase family protein n=1 Tax=Marinifilum sp. TaxID=2033137 RepID=UPI003BAD244D